MAFTIALVVLMFLSGAYAQMMPMPGGMAGMPGGMMGGMPGGMGGMPGGMGGMPGGMMGGMPGGMGGMPGGPGGMMPDPLLRNVSQEALQQFFQILQNTALTKREMETQLDAWAAAQGGDVLTEYNSRKAQCTEMKTNLANLFANLSANLSTDAKDLLTKLKAVSDNLDITFDEEMKQKRQLLDDAFEDVQREIFMLFDGLQGQIARHRGMAGDLPGHHCLEMIVLPPTAGGAGEIGGGMPGGMGGMPGGMGGMPGGMGGMPGGMGGMPGALGGMIGGMGGMAGGMVGMPGPVPQRR